MEITLIMGFLGTGKTTLVNNLLEKFDNIKTGFVINDFGSIPIDATLLNESSSQSKIYSINNGSICCTCKQHELLKALVYFHENNYEKVIVESSGISDPYLIEKTLRDSKYKDVIAISRAVTIITPDSYLKLERNIKVINKQVGYSDALVVNKCDNTNNEILEQVISKINRLNPGAKIFRTSFCKFDYYEIMEPDNTRRELLYYTDPEMKPVAITYNGKLTLKQLNWLMQELSGEILRLKGVIKIDKRYYSVSNNLSEVIINAVAQNFDINMGINIIAMPINIKKVKDALKNIKK